MMRKGGQGITLSVEALFNPALKRNFKKVDTDSKYLGLSTDYILVSTMLETQLT